MTSYEVRIANVIFIDAVTYIMFHEVAHIVNGHWDSYKEISLKLANDDDLNEQEKILSKLLEQEADTFAYDCLINSNDDDVIQYHKQFGIIIADLSSIFALKANTPLTSITHPSVHVRIFNSRERRSFSEESEFHLDRVMNVGLSMFCRLQSIPYEDQNFGSFPELLDYLFNLLEVRSNQRLPH